VGDIEIRFVARVVRWGEEGCESTTGATARGAIWRTGTADIARVRGIEIRLAGRGHSAGALRLSVCQEGQPDQELAPQMTQE
jgi:hypothetical protein